MSQDQITIGQLGNKVVGETISSFAEIVKCAPTIDVVEAALDARLQAFGIDHYFCFQGADAGSHILGNRMRGKTNKVWNQRYTEKGFARHDQLLRHGLMSPEPTTWSRFKSEVTLSREQQLIFREAGECGLRDGFFLPIHRLDGSMYGVAMMVPRLLDRDERLLASLHMLALYYGLAVRKFCFAPQAARIPPSTKPLLTSRQRECLQWVRAGKTDWEIGQILGISQRTVIEHLELARRRLGVTTRTQAVIEAISKGLVHI